jgi:hypothetical protein
MDEVALALGRKQGVSKERLPEDKAAFSLVPTFSGGWYFPSEDDPPREPILSQEELAERLEKNWSGLRRRVLLLPAFDQEQLYKNLVKDHWATVTSLSERDVAEAPVARLNPNAVHNDDFTMVKWYDTDYRFALGAQAGAVRALWEEWERSGLGLHQETIHNLIDPERRTFRMDMTFRHHPALGKMIRAVGDGVYQLFAPDCSVTQGEKIEKSRQKLLGSAASAHPPLK